MTSESVSQTNRPRLDWSAIRRFRSGDEAEILEVVVGGFEGWPWFDLSVPVFEHLKWRLEGHRPNENRHWIVELDSRVVSVTVETELDVKVAGVTRSLAIEGAASTLPDYQGRGIWSGMWNFRVANQRPLYDITLTISTNPIVLRGWARDTSPRLHMGNEIRALIKVLDVRRAASIHEEAGGRLQRNLVARIAAFAGLRLMGLLHTRHRRSNKSLTVNRIERFDERIDTFWEQASKPFDFIIERRCDFLNWRYCDPRGGKHAVFLAEKDDEILGYIVVRTSSATRGQILDLLTLPDRQDVVEALLAAGLASLREAGVASISCWMPSTHPYNGDLKRSGFVDSRRKLNFGWWLRPDTEHSDLEFLQDPDALVHVMEGEVQD